jgi:hypothetical protein
VILGIVYGLIEEGFATQSLFNPNYLSMNLHLLQPAFVPQLRIGALWTVYVLTLHAAWSIATPIALIEGLVPEKAEHPWLNRAGMVGTTLLFIFGVAAVALMSYKKDHFISSHMQFVCTAALCIALAVTAVRLPHAQSVRVRGWVPGPGLAGTIALTAGSAVLVVPHSWNWGAVAAILAADLGMCGIAFFLGKRMGWTMRQKLVLASGAALAYAWHSFLQGAVVGSSALEMRVGHVTFALGALALIMAAARRTTAYQMELVFERTRAGVCNLLDSPRRGFGKHRVFILLPFGQAGKESRQAAVAHGDGDVPAQAFELCSLNGRAEKEAAKALLVQLGQPVESGVHQLGSRLQLRIGGNGGFAVPRANVLANVATEDLTSDSFSQFERDRSSFFNRQVRDA